MSYYLRTDANGHSTTWHMSDTEAVRIGVPSAREVPGCYFPANLGEPIFEAIRRLTPWFEPDGENPFHEIDLAQGQYYPRMARPNDRHPLESPGNNPMTHLEQEIVLKTRSQTTLLARRLSELFETIHPTKDNFQVYGNDIRNLLILAAMEVEAQWKGILRSNNAKGANTNDYVKLLPAMKLDSYWVALSEYPWLDPVGPFVGWSASKPTQSLKWYDAYNATKHDRESEFTRATLEHAISAVCANVVLLAAQYGVPYGLGQRTRLADEFILEKVPCWSPHGIYIYPYDCEHTEVAYPFS